MTQTNDWTARSYSSCGGTETMARLDNELFEIAHSGRHETIGGLSGWRCKNCEEVVFDPESAERYAASGDTIVLQARSA